MRKSIWIQLASLLLVSAASISFEIALSRYFAVANWAEFGYWVISLAMAGYAASGVLLCLFRDFFYNRRRMLFFALPCLLMAFAAAGFYFTSINQFNPLQFQNPQSWGAQLGNICKYYAALFPFFFCAGLFVGLNYISLQDNIGRVYATDLIGAGLGAMLIIAAMFVVHPFFLMCVALPPLLLAALLNQPAHSQINKSALALCAIAIFAAAGYWTVAHNKSDFFEFKPIYTALHVQNGKIVKQALSPKGYYIIADNFTEREDVALSNNYTLLGAGGPPKTFGLYRDGFRITSFAKPGANMTYVNASLEEFPYTYKPGGNVLLIGTRGGSRVVEAALMNASSITALEPDNVIYSLLEGYSATAFANMPAGAKFEVLNKAPQAFLSGRHAGFDLIDVSPDFLDQSEENKYSYTAEAFEMYYNSLAPDGILSVPVSIREFTVYAVKTALTAEKALENMGVSPARDHIAVYRSSWDARVLISRQPFTGKKLEALKAFCSDRSFDTSYYPGIEPRKIEIWNELPSVTFDETAAQSRSAAPQDALADELVDVLVKKSEPRSGKYFNLRPSTVDRPLFYSILRPSRLGGILKKIQLVPREEIGYLINFAVLIQAASIALIVLLLPMLKLKGKEFFFKLAGRGTLYFLGLGLGFLFVEMALIEKATLFLNDRTSSFAVVLSGMLVFSGLGGFYSSRFAGNSVKAVRIAVMAIGLLLVIYSLFLNPVLFALIGLPFAVKSMIVVIITAPLAFAMGFPYPLGLSALRSWNSDFIPWAWSINGAFSVIATPLANIISVSYGFTPVLILSVLLYILVALTHPRKPAAE